MNEWMNEWMKSINPYSAGIDFRRQNLTSVTLDFDAKIDPRTVRVNKIPMAVDP